MLGLTAFNLYLFLPGYLFPETLAERNIRLAGKNGKQLAQVLEHYRRTGEEQKERCARFLIAYMDRRAAITYEEGIGQKTKIVTPDLLAIRADFLIENIDLAFEAWKRYPWCRHLTEDEFCRKLLPYRLKNEKLEGWRKFYYRRTSLWKKPVAALATTWH